MEIKGKEPPREGAKVNEEEKERRRKELHNPRFKRPQFRVCRPH